MPSWNKKTAAEGSRKRKALQKIQNYLEDHNKAVDLYNQSLQDYLLIHDIGPCFNNLHLYLNKSMLEYCQKYQVLQDGVYILLEGCVTYVWSKNKYDKGQKGHLFALAKSGNYSNLAQNSPDRTNLLANGYSLLINSPMSVLQCDLGNICCSDECVLLKIPTKVLEDTQFYELRAQRIGIFNKAKLPAVYSIVQEQYVNFNVNFHHTFKFRKMVFRNKFQVSTLGIVVSGTACIKKINKQKTQFTAHCLLVPNLEYEVSSANMEIIQIYKNPTVTILKPELINSFVNSLTQVEENKQNLEITKYRDKIAVSVSLHKEKTLDSILVREEKKKSKQFNLFSKECETFCVVPLEFRKQRLDLIKSFKAQDTKQISNRIPQILFSCKNKKRSHHRQMSSPAIDQNSKILDKSIEKSINEKSSLMNRYENYAKSLYTDFMKKSKVNSSKLLKKRIQ